MKRLISIIVSVSTLAFYVTTLIFPDVQIDVKVLLLIAIACLPWLAPTIKSIELPGGVKIEFRARTRKP